MSSLGSCGLKCILCTLFNKRIEDDSLHDQQSVYLVFLAFAFAAAAATQSGLMSTPCGTRTRNLRIRSLTPCPLGQGGCSIKVIQQCWAQPEQACVCRAGSGGPEHFLARAFEGKESRTRSCMEARVWGIAAKFLLGGCFSCLRQLLPALAPVS